jgi:hypothetical protein
MSQTAYTTLTNLKNYLNIASTTTTYDALLTSLIPQVQAFVDRYTGRTFGWGDTGDSTQFDYSNTDNLGITSATISGTNCTFTFFAATPYVVGGSLIATKFVPTAINGTWVITAVSPDQTEVTVNLGIGGVQNATVIGEVAPDTINYQFRQQEAYDGLVGHTFYLMNMDIRSINQLWVGSRNIYPPVLLDPEQYVWRDDGRIILGGAYFNTYNSADYTGADDTTDFYGTIAAGFQTITVSYHYGYIGVPPEIALATLDICAVMNRLRTSVGIKSEMAGDYRLQHDETLRATMANCPDSLGILNTYRRLHL